MNDDVDCTIWAETVKNFVAEKAALGLAPEPISSPPPKAKDIRKQGEVWKAGKDWKIRIAEIDEIAQGNRDLVCGNFGMIEKIDQVQRSNPHFGSIISFFRRSLLASKNTRRPIRIPHILLVGPPGVGKTHVVRSIAEAIGLPFHILDAPSQSGASIFSGTDKSWKNPRPGKIAEALIQSPIASQIILLDELDKAYQYPGESDTLAPLHSLLEPSTAGKWRDECLSISIDARYLTVVATANCIRNIAPSLLDRFTIFRIEKPDPSFLLDIIRSIFCALRDDFGTWFENDLDPAIIAAFREESPRQIRKRLHDAMMNAAAMGRRRIISKDLSIPSDQDHSRQIGFIRTR